MTVQSQLPSPEHLPRRRVIDDPQTAHFITFSCDGRRKLLNQDRCKRIVIHFLEEVRSECDGLCLGFVIMPEHLHVLIRFRERGRLVRFKLEWKRRSSLALIEYFQKNKNPMLEFLTRADGSHRVWTPKQYDFNVLTHDKAWEKLNYMHQNPVKRDLSPTPEAWPFSSARWYAARKSVGVTLSHIDE